MLDITVGAVPAIGWTALRVERLTQLWADGCTAGEIASDLGGITRNAVLGKLHRLGKAKSCPETKQRPPRGADREPRGKRGANADRSLTQTIRKARQFAVPVEVEPPAEFLGVEFADIQDGQCRFPHGDLPTITFCGQPARVGSYCRSCHRIAYYRPAPSNTPFRFKAW